MNQRTELKGNMIAMDENIEQQTKKREIALAKLQQLRDVRRKISERLGGNQDVDDSKVKTVTDMLENIEFQARLVMDQASTAARQLNQMKKAVKRAEEGGSTSALGGLIGKLGDAVSLVP